MCGLQEYSKVKDIKTTQSEKTENKKKMERS